jgi:hypothetical protein
MITKSKLARDGFPFWLTSRYSNGQGQIVWCKYLLLAMALEVTPSKIHKDMRELQSTSDSVITALAWPQMM